MSEERTENITTSENTLVPILINHYLLLNLKLNGR